MKLDFFSLLSQKIVEIMNAGNIYKRFSLEIEQDLRDNSNTVNLEEIIYYSSETAATLLLSLLMAGRGALPSRELSRGLEMGLSLFRGKPPSVMAKEGSSNPFFMCIDASVCSAKPVTSSGRVTISCCNNSDITGSTS